MSSSLDPKDGVTAQGETPFKRSIYFWEKKASQMLSLISGSGSTSSTQSSPSKRSATTSTLPASSPGTPTSSAVATGVGNDTTARNPSSPALQKRKSTSFSSEVLQHEITPENATSAIKSDLNSPARDTSPGPRKAFRINDAGDLVGSDLKSQAGRSSPPRNGGYESDSRAAHVRTRSSSQMSASPQIDSGSSSPSLSSKKKRSSSVSSNSPGVERKPRPGVPDLRAQLKTSGHGNSSIVSAIASATTVSPAVSARNGSATPNSLSDSPRGSVMREDHLQLTHLQEVVKALAEQVATLQSALNTEKAEREAEKEKFQAKLADQERAISTLADAVQRQVGLLDHFRSEIDQLKQNQSVMSSPSITLASSMSEGSHLQDPMQTSHNSVPADSADESTAVSGLVTSSGSQAAAGATAQNEERHSQSVSTRTRTPSSPKRRSTKSTSIKERKSSRSVTRDRSMTLDISMSPLVPLPEVPKTARSTSSSRGSSSRSILLKAEDASTDSAAASPANGESRIKRSKSAQLKNKSSVLKLAASAEGIPPEKKKSPTTAGSSQVPLAVAISSDAIRSPSANKFPVSTPSLLSKAEHRMSDSSDFGGIEGARSAKAKVRRPASTTLLDSPLSARSSDFGSELSPQSERRAKKGKSSRANKLMERMTPAEQEEAMAASIADINSPRPRRDSGVLSRSDSSSESLKDPSSGRIARRAKSDAYLYPPGQSSMAPTSPSTNTLSTTDLVVTRSRGNSVVDLELAGKLGSLGSLTAGAAIGAMAATLPAEDDDSEELPIQPDSSRIVPGESDASSGDDTRSRSQIIRRVPIFGTIVGRSFGVSLTQVPLDDRSVPVAIVNLTNVLKHEKPAPADLFDRQVDATKVEALRKRLDSATQVSSSFTKDCDVYVVAAVLKRFFSELPDALLGSARRAQWLEAADIDDDVVRVPVVRTLYHSMERTCRKTLEYMVVFFNRLIDNSAGQLTLKHLAKLFGPLFLRPTTAGSSVSSAASPTPSGGGSGGGFSSHFDTTREMASITAPESLSDNNDILNLAPTMLEDRSITLLAVFIRQYPNIFLLKCPGIEFKKRTFQLRAATVDNFVGLILDGNYSEKEFPDIFWTTYVYFIDSDDLLTRFSVLYREYNLESRWESKYRIKILFALKMWIRRYGNQLVGDENFKTEFQRFLADALQTASETSLEKPILTSLQKSTIGAPLNSESSEMLAKIMAGVDVTKADTAVSYTRLARTDSGRRLLNSRGLMIIDVLTFDPKNLASQITLLDYKLVHMIDPSELLNGNPMIPQKSPIYTAMVRCINRITDWVAFEILSRNTPQERARILTFFIEVAYQCRKLNNFNGSWAVFGAFGIHPVSRLAQTWERLSRRDAARFKKLGALFEPRMNFSEYRKQLDRALHEGSCIPILAFLPKDIIRYETDPTFTEDRLVDFDKMRGIYYTLQQLTHCRNDAALPAKDDELYDLLLSLPDFKGEELDQLSMKAEPKLSANRQ